MASIMAAAIACVTLILFAGLLYVHFSQARLKEKLEPIRLRLENRVIRKPQKSDHDHR